MPKWTKEQKQAIYEKGNNILVAAAAGSGKTAVLVERIINKAINEKIDINKLLVVTFTNAAASEMRERVLNAIYKKLEEEPENENLQRQISLLNIANICTIDSFCLDIVKNNFYELDNISPNFRIAETTEIEILKQEILDELFEQKYEQDNEDFIKLINTYTSYKDDTPLKDLILKIYNYINSNPFPKEWLKQKVEMFNIKDKLNEDFSRTIWGKILLQEIKDELIDDISILMDAQKMINNNDDFIPFYQTIESDIQQLEIIKANLDNWDKAYEIFQKFNFVIWPRKKNDSDLKDEVKAIRDSVKKKFKQKLEKILISTSEQNNQDIYDMYNILQKLQNLVLEFEDVFSKKKKEKNIADFNDIEHFALNILIKKDEYGNIHKTEVAKRYMEQFEEIAIDEYQDSNEVQEYILSSVSRGNNIFMVGDVKQSIYKFRQAMPELFLNKYNSYSIIEDTFLEEDDINITNNTKEEINKLLENKDIKGKKIQLFKNFRSRNNILDFTNLIFKNIMSQQLGEIEYNKKEFLNFGAEYYKENNQNIKTEINIINMKKNIEPENEIDILQEEEQEYFEDLEIEAKFIANKIEELIKNKYQIYDKKIESYRNATYKDIAILLRSTKNKANIYEQEITKLGIPVFCDNTQDYLETIEIQTIMSLLKIIDNPIQDIPLVTVLRSNIAGFTDDELVEIRLSDKNSDFYHCMIKAKTNTTEILKEKIITFLDKLEQWRKENEYLALDELIWKIYKETGFYNYVGLMTNGNLRQANLKMLFERAKKYETTSFRGLYNFINFIERLKTSSGDLNSAKIIGENDNVVRIMSIHKSKGLEFPIVFIANTNKQFNEQDLKKESVLLHKELGIGAKYINYNAQVQYDTLTREAVKNIIRNENISEEMRILYVATTRAKEKLIITGLTKDAEKLSEKIKKQVNIYNKKSDKINPILIKKFKTYLEWILLTYEYEKNNVTNLLDLNIINLSEIIKNDNEKELVSSKDILKIIEEKNIDESLIKSIQEKIEYDYPNKLLTTIPTKTSVTKIKLLKQINDLNKNNEEEKKSINNEIFFTKPLFMQDNEEQELTSAEKGTVIHKCLQLLNNKEKYNMQKIKQLLDTMQFKKIITEKEKKSINPYKILEYTKSKIWEELIEAKEIYKEKPFYTNIPANEIYNTDVNENILVQGIIDLYFIDKNDKLVLVDYKTDFVKEGEEDKLAYKYNEQLKLYKDALEDALGRKVDRVIIYSVYLGKEILV